MCSKRFSLVCLLALLCSVAVFSQDTAKQKIISQQELILSICQSLIESLDMNDSTLQRELENLQDEKRALAQEKIDFENYKTETIESAPQLLELKKQVKKQSEQLANLNNILSIGAPVAIVIIAIEAIALAFK